MFIMMRNFIMNAIKWNSKRSRSKNWRKCFTKNTKEQVLSKSQIADVKKYYENYRKVNTLFHNFYTEKTEKFYVEYIPDDLYYCYIDPFYNDWEKAKIVDNKCFYSCLFKGVAQAENIVCRINNLWLSENYTILKKDEVKTLLRRYDSFFLKKATDSEGGIGVFFFDGEDRVERLFKKVSGISGDIVIQKPLIQHEALSKINASSVNTIRVLSLLSDSGVKVYSSILRIGINGAKVDNASSGGITCGIDNNGKLKGVAYSAKGDKYIIHPDSGLTFLGYDIPGFSSVIELVSTLHPQIPHFRLVSWDFAIDEAGVPVLIEANLKYGELDFHQLNNGPVFGEDTHKILTEVFGANK